MSEFLDQFNIQEKVIMKSNASDAAGGLRRLQENPGEAGKPEEAERVGEMAEDLEAQFEVDGDE